MAHNPLNTTNLSSAPYIAKDGTIIDPHIINNEIIMLKLKCWHCRLPLMLTKQEAVNLGNLLLELANHVEKTTITNR